MGDAFENESAGLGALGMAGYAVFAGECFTARRLGPQDEGERGDSERAERDICRHKFRAVGQTAGASRNHSTEPILPRAEGDRRNRFGQRSSSRAAAMAVARFHGRASMEAAMRASGGTALMPGGMTLFETLLTLVEPNWCFDLAAL